MICLGLDAGKNCGFAVLDVEPAGRATFIDTGKLDKKRRIAHVEEILSKHHGIEHVGVEVPAQLYRQLTERGAAAAAARALMDAVAIGYEIAGHLRARGRRVETFTASDSRRALQCLGKRGRKADNRVKDVLALRVRDWPESSNTHARDAAIAALFVGLRAHSLKHGPVGVRIIESGGA